MFDRFRGGNFMKSSVRRTGFYRPLMLCLTLVLFIAAAFSVSGFLSLAKEKEDAVSYKYFSSIMVRSGDTLSSIAASNGGSWNQYTGYRSGNPNVIYAARPSAVAPAQARSPPVDGTWCVPATPSAASPHITGSTCTASTDTVPAIRR